MAEEIVIGAEVVTADGKKLGTVKQAEGGAFLVNAPRQLDYWLEADLVGNATAERVELLIKQGDLGPYKMDNPNDHNAFQEKSQQERDIAALRQDSIARAHRTRP